MGSVEFSPATRWGTITTGLLQGLVYYLLIVWSAGKNHSWTAYGVSTIVVSSSVLLLSAISFKQRCLWGRLALVFVATTRMSGWSKWQTDGMNPRRAERAVWDFDCHLLLMAMLLSPWIQQSFHIRDGSSRYSYFYQSVWHNVLILLVISLANGLTWLVLLLWGELSKLVGIKSSNTLSSVVDWLTYLTLGPVTALAMILVCTQSCLIDSIQKLFTLIAMGLLPLAPLLTLMFIITLPFTGLSAISRYISTAGLLLMLAFL